MKKGRRIPMSDITSEEKVETTKEVTSDAVKAEETPTEVAAVAETAECEPEAAQPKRRGRKPKVLTEPAANEPAQPDLDETSDTKVAETLEEESVASEETAELNIKTPRPTTEYILLDPKIPLYRSASEDFRISGASGMATVLGKEGKFTKIIYVRRGIGAQEGYVILDE